MTQGMGTNVNPIANQVQSMTAQLNQEFEPHVNQSASTITLHIRDFTRMNPKMFF